MLPVRGKGGSKNDYKWEIHMFLVLSADMGNREDINDWSTVYSWSYAGFLSVKHFVSPIMDVFEVQKTIWPIDLFGIEAETFCMTPLDQLWPKQYY